MEVCETVSMIYVPSEQEIFDSVYDEMMDMTVGEFIATLRGFDKDWHDELQEYVMQVSLESTCEIISMKMHA
jgi:hypothetical protein